MPISSLRSMLRGPSEETLEKINSKRQKAGKPSWPDRGDAENALRQAQRWFWYDQHVSKEEAELDALWASCQMRALSGGIAHVLELMGIAQEKEATKQHPRYEELLSAARQNKPRPKAIGLADEALGIDGALRETLFLMAEHPDDRVVAELLDSSIVREWIGFARLGNTSSDAWLAYRKRAREALGNGQVLATMSREQLEEARTLAQGIYERVRARVLGDVQGGVEYTKLLDKFLSLHIQQGEHWQGETIDCCGVGFTLDLSGTERQAQGQGILVGRIAAKFEVEVVRKRLSTMGLDVKSAGVSEMLADRNLSPERFSAMLAELQDPEAIEEMWDWAFYSLSAGKGMFRVQEFVISRLERGEELDATFCSRVSRVLRWKDRKFLSAIRFLPVPGRGQSNQHAEEIRSYVAEHGVPQDTDGLEEYMLLARGACGAQLVEVIRGAGTLYRDESSKALNTILDGIQPRQWATLEKTHWAALMATPYEEIRNKVFSMMGKQLGKDDPKTRGL